MQTLSSFSEYNDFFLYFQGNWCWHRAISQNKMNLFSIFQGNRCWHRAISQSITKRNNSTTCRQRKNPYLFIYHGYWRCNMCLFLLELTDTLNEIGPLLYHNEIQLTFSPKRMTIISTRFVIVWTKTWMLERFVYSTILSHTILIRF